MKILVADDELPARNELCYALSELLAEAELHQARDGDEALSKLQKDRFDLVFLDIQMPGQDGLTVAAKILEQPEAPRIVFATAYSEHAVEAFRLSALDYLVKPVREDRLQETLKRVTVTGPDQREGLRHLFEARNEAKIWAEAGDGRWVLLDPDSILYFMAEDKKVFAHSEGREPLRVKKTLKELESTLASARFLRVHKGYLVNLERVREMSAWFSGSYTLVMDSKGDIQVPLSRRFAAKFREATGW